MAEVVNEMPGNFAKNYTYPWSDWLNGRVWKIEPGKDFTTREVYFRNQAYAAARRHNKRMSIRVKDGFIYMQAVNLNGAAK